MSPSASTPYDCEYYANGVVRHIDHPYQHSNVGDLDSFPCSNAVGLKLLI